MCDLQIYMNGAMKVERGNVPPIGCSYALLLAGSALLTVED